MFKTSVALSLFSVLSLTSFAACDREPSAAPVASAKAGADKAEVIKIVSPQELAKLRETAPHLAIIDANPKKVFDAGHVPGARLVEDEEGLKALLPADRAAPVVFYCYNEACGASHGAAQLAVAAGHTNVLRMKAGIEGWKAAGLPTEQ